MKDDLKEAPALGLYLAAFWLSIIMLPVGIYQIGIREYAEEVRDVFQSIGDRHG